MFRILVLKNRISVEFCHILTDGSGALEFFKYLLLLYFKECGTTIPGGDFSFLRTDNIVSEEEYEDSYNRYFKENIPPMVKQSKAFHLPYSLNPTGICYVTGLGFHQVHNPHDRESAYTKSLGWGPKPGITVFGPGIPGWRNRSKVIPGVRELAKERQFVDDIGTISFTEFAIFETMAHDALYTVLSGGGKWNGSDPYIQ